MDKYKVRTISYILLVVIPLISCNKSRFLSAKPDQSLLVPSSLTDFQELLDNDRIINGTGGYGIVPSFGEAGSDNYYCPDDQYNTVVPPLYQSIYIWEKALYASQITPDWDYPYQAIFYANNVLDGICNIKKTSTIKGTWNNVKGEALFIRSHMFYQLAQVFAPPFNKANASSQLGIPLRLSADINEPIYRSTLTEAYDRIISDLKVAIRLLPEKALYKTRPSKPAAYALLARVYQTMQYYDTALVYADSCLALENSLIDYNTLDTTSYTPFLRFNKEVLYNCTLQSTDNAPFIGYEGGFVDTLLYRSYQDNDLRKSIFFKDLGNGGYTFLGTYDGEYLPFGGIATDEVYFIRAECYARAGKIGPALTDLNTLLINRWKAGTFVPYTASTEKGALNLILIERRKELCFRGLRWTDLRRLNQDPEHAIKLYRVIKGQTYTLLPNDPCYTYPIPDKVIHFHPNMPQNNR